MSLYFHPMVSVLPGMPELRPGLLTCSISNGMFPDEYAVEVLTEAGDKVSLFVSDIDVQIVDQIPSTGQLRVRFYAKDVGTVFVLLPSETMEEGRTVISVPKSAVRDFG